MGILTGFIEGVVTYSNDGTPELLPFQDKIEGATFRYQGESIDVETFSAEGIKGLSASCPFRQMAEFELMSKDLAWSFLQAATGYLAKTSTLPVFATESFVVPAPVTPATDSVVTLSNTPLLTEDIYASDINGLQYDISVSGDEVTFDGDQSGNKVTIHYFYAPPVGTAEIALGSSQSIGEIGVYGRFFGCPESLLVVAKRGIIIPNLEMAVESDGAQASLTVKCMRDENGDFARIIRLPA